MGSVFVVVVVVFAMPEQRLRPNLQIPEKEQGHTISQTLPKDNNSTLGVGGGQPLVESLRYWGPCHSNERADGLSAGTEDKS